MSGGVDSHVADLDRQAACFDYDVHGFTIVNADERYEEQRHGRARGRASSACATPRSRSTPRASCRSCASSCATTTRRVYTITYFVHWLLMEAIARARLPDLGQRHGGRRAVHAATTTTTSPTCATIRDEPALHARSVGELAASTSRRSCATRSCQDPDLLRRGPGAAATTSTSTPTSSRGYLTRAVRRAVRRGATTPTTLLRNRMLNELFHESVPVILHEDDLNAMYFSIENRSPFLDRELFEFSLVDPDRATSCATAWPRPCCATRCAASCPTAILDNRRKVGFNAPILDLLDVERPRGARASCSATARSGSTCAATRSRSCSTRDYAAQQREQVPLQLPVREAVPRGVRAMRLDRQSSRRATFEVGRRGGRLRHVADVVARARRGASRCAPTSGTEVDVTRKSWGYYATPSLNGRLREHGLRAALGRRACRGTATTASRMYLLLVERGPRATTSRPTSTAEEMRVVAWLDTDEAVARGGRAELCLNGADEQPATQADAGDLGALLRGAGRAARPTTPPRSRRSSAASRTTCATAARPATTASSTSAEMGCGAGPNLVWLAEKGIACQRRRHRADRARAVRADDARRRGSRRPRRSSSSRASVTDVPLRDDASLDGIVESCVFQHLPREDRLAAFARGRPAASSPAALFVGHMLERGHTRLRSSTPASSCADDPGHAARSRRAARTIYLTNIGLSPLLHRRRGASSCCPAGRVVDPCLSQYELPRGEAAKRGYDRYLQSMLVVYAVK